MRSYYRGVPEHNDASLEEPQVVCYEYDTTKIDDTAVLVAKTWATEVDSQEVADVSDLLRHATIQSPDYYTHQALNKVRSMLPWHERWGLTAIHTAEQIAQCALQLVG